MSCLHAFCAWAPDAYVTYLVRIALIVPSFMLRQQMCLLDGKLFCKHVEINKESTYVTVT
ncbi:hypothetical protein C0Q70_17545 [Pomacea canaliculata]|uniref:Uncharacterized protein n=1 Tax=Pomacea canaliculata TaxID=400727 RepID=A0A2T7NKP6_POMCA|nr:hypothetical protein C0Q70_17545 [Pomacea canaliculata]